MDFTKFFGPTTTTTAAPAPATEVTMPKKRTKRGKRRREDQRTDEEMPDEVAALVKSWQASRMVAKGLTRMGVERVTLESMAKTAPWLDLESALRRISAICEKAVQIEDGAVFFPGLSFADRKMGRNEEIARTQMVKEALLRCNRERPKALEQEVAQTPEKTSIDKAANELDVPTEAEGEEAGLVRFLRSLSWYEDQIAHVEVVEARSARFSQSKLLPRELIPRPLYEHQAEAIDASLSSKHVALCTGTASGKTLAYALLAMDAVTRCPDACVALFMFPTKALAQDQVASFRRLAESMGIAKATIGTLDGDTDVVHREAIAAKPPSVVVTNPDMLHHTLLPCAASKWQAIFDQLSLVVIDEAHVYVGAFGSHVAAIVRRLRRVAPHDLRFMCCSATIANPRQHATRLLGIKDSADLVIVEEDTSPHGHKSVIVWNPPIKDPEATQDPKKTVRKRRRRRRNQPNARWRHAPPLHVASNPCEAIEEQPPDEGSETDECSLSSCDEDSKRALTQDERTRFMEMKRGRREMLQAMQASADATEQHFARRKSPIYELARLFACLVSKGVRTLAFARTRKLVELVLGYARDLVHPEFQSKIAAYRGGYSKSERRAIEAGLFGGELVGVVATCALELGVDVGDLDATLHLGHPGSIASLWQQAGRAGRRPEAHSIAVIVCWDSPVDQQYARCGSELLKRKVESAALEVANECVLRDHLLCAAVEHPPLRDSVDCALFVGRTTQIYHQCIARLSERGDLVRLNGTPEGEWIAHPSSRETCHKAVNVRMIDPVTFQVKLTTTKEVVDEVPYSRAFFELYEGAIYLHQAKPNKIVKLDLDVFEAWAHPLPRCDYHTSSRNHTNADPVKRLETWRNVTTGVVHVTAKVWGYRKVSKRSGRILSMHEFNLPALEFETRGTWIDVPVEAIQQIESEGRDHLAGIHALNHALLVVAPLFVTCDRNDLDTEHVYPYQQRPRPPRVIIFDARPGGLGVADQMFRRIHAVLKQTLAVLTSCPCHSEGGCPACLHHQSCSAYNVVLDRPAAASIVTAVLRRQASAGAIPASPPRPFGLVKPDETTPRRASRAKALRDAGAMEARRPGTLAQRAASLRPQWVPCLPDFSPNL